MQNSNVFIINSIFRLHSKDWLFYQVDLKLNIVDPPINL